VFPLSTPHSTHLPTLVSQSVSVFFSQYGKLFEEAKQQQQQQQNM